MAWVILVAVAVVAAALIRKLPDPASRLADTDDPAPVESVPLHAWDPADEEGAARRRPGPEEGVAPPAAARRLRALPPRTARTRKAGRGR